MADGTRLYARIWRPVTDEPVPALLEYLPYRLGDWTAPRDAQRHPYYAGHGYASVRVDIRGAGGSEGRVQDEYSVQETDDGVAVVQWLADQAWCSGRVGMFGISWGGFNSLQIAARAPEALRAIVTVCSTDDRYDNDVHYIGGAVLGVDMHAWAATMLAFASRPLDPAQVGEVWRERWLDRLKHLEPYIHPWLTHQTRDDYWRRGSVCEDYAAIKAPTLAVGGWADPYRDTVLRLVEHLEAPVRGIVGPWSHQYPDIGLPPGPAIGFLQETLRWWDHWLKDVDTGVMADPALRAWVNESVPPATSYDERPGRWVGAERWPAPEVQPRRWGLAERLRTTEPEVDGQVVVCSPQHTGVDAGRYFPYGNSADLPPDQREEDGRSVCFDSGPLGEPLEILGRPRVGVRLRCDRTRGHVVARLCDVAPDRSSTLVTVGVLNLTSRNGRESSVDWDPQVSEDVSLELKCVGHRFAPGHRVRLAVSTAYWPWVWPHPEPVELRVEAPRSWCELPVREAGGDEDRAAITFAEPEQAPPLPVVFGDPPADRPERRVVRDVARGEWVLEVDPRYGGTRTYPDGLVYDEDAFERYWITDGDPQSARTRSDWVVRLRRPELGWDVEVRTRSEIRCDADAFVTEDHVVAREGEDVIFDRRWPKRIPRTAG